MDSAFSFFPHPYAVVADLRVAYGFSKGNDEQRVSPPRRGHRNGAGSVSLRPSVPFSFSFYFLVAVAYSADCGPNVDRTLNVAHFEHQLEVCW